MACMWEHTLFLPDGTRQDVDWKAWEPSNDPVTLRWELKRILPAAGYVTRSRGTRVCVIFGKHVQLWDTMFEGFGWDVSSCRGSSQRSLPSKKKTDTEEETLQTSEQEYWVDTKSLIALLLHWSCSRKRADQRQLADLLGSCFLRACAGVDACVCVSVADLSEEQVSVCNLGRDSAASCICMEGYNTKLAELDTSGAPQQLSWQMMCLLRDIICCPCARNVLSDVIEKLALSVDTMRGQWAADDLLKCRSIVHYNGRGKRTRTDPHMKQIVTDTALEQYLNPTPQACAVSNKVGSRRTGSRWAEQAMADQIAACHLSYESPGIMSYAFDAAKMGNPGVDYLFNLQSDWPQGRGSVLPIQD